MKGDVGDWVGTFYKAIFSAFEVQVYEQVSSRLHMDLEEVT